MGGRLLADRCRSDWRWTLIGSQHGRWGLLTGHNGVCIHLYPFGQQSCQGLCVNNRLERISHTTWWHSNGLEATDKGCGHPIIGRHERRVLSQTPGIGGCWDLNGNESTRFNMGSHTDLVYCRNGVWDHIHAKIVHVGHGGVHSTSSRLPTAILGWTYRPRSLVRTRAYWPGTRWKPGSCLRRMPQG